MSSGIDVKNAVVTSMKSLQAETLTDREEAEGGGKKRGGTMRKKRKRNGENKEGRLLFLLPPPPLFVYCPRGSKGVSMRGGGQERG